MMRCAKMYSDVRRVRLYASFCASAIRFVNVSQSPHVHGIVSLVAAESHQRVLWEALVHGKWNVTSSCYVVQERLWDRNPRSIRTIERVVGYFLRFEHESVKCWHVRVSHTK